MDGSAENMSRLRRRPWFWRHDLEARACFLTRENVDQAIASWTGNDEVGLLHIDVDGNDYWLWDAISSVVPGIVVMEYNAVLGAERALSVPYKPDFRRLAAHHSGQYFGASLAALAHLANLKGYALVGCNGAGNNAYFVRREWIGNEIREVSVQEAYSAPTFRDSRNSQGHLDFRDLAGRQSTIRGMPMIDVTTGKEEPF